MIKRIHKVRQRVNKAVCCLLVAALLAPIGNIVGSNDFSVEAYGKTGVEESIIKSVEEETTTNEVETPSVAAETTTEQKSGSEETTTAVETTTEEEITTEPITTQAPTTPTPTTTQIPTTTKPVTETTTKLQPWGKNQNGEFVNGNKKVIKGATMKGIDVSHHQGKINWKKVSESDVDYAIIRCGYGDNIKSQDDKCWEENVAGCEKYNIPYGVYIYSYATTVNQAKSEAEHVLRLIKGQTLNFPIYLDMEDAVQVKLSNTKRREIADTFLNTIHAAGYECGVYANLNWWNNYIPSGISNNLLWYKWVAQYNDKACTYTGTYQMWQSTSTGTVPGISGNVDINFWFGEVRTRSYDIKRYGTVAAPKPVTSPKRVTIKSLKKGKKKATLKWNKISSAKGYKIQYSTSKKFKKAKAKTTTKTSIVIKKLKSKKIYYFRIKAYKLNASNKKVYSNKWSKVKYTKIK